MLTWFYTLREQVIEDVCYGRFTAADLCKMTAVTRKDRAVCRLYSVIILADFTSLTACLQLLIVMQIFFTLSFFSCPAKLDSLKWPPAN